MGHLIYLSLLFFQVGPAGAHLGVVGCMIIEGVNMWHLMKTPSIFVARMMTITAFFLTFGFLPWIDNFAHIFGAVFGVAYTYIIVPYAVMGRYEREKRVVFMTTSGIFVTGFGLLLMSYFYFHPVEECLLSLCHLLTCIPFTKNFCAEQNINFIKTGDV